MLRFRFTVPALMIAGHAFEIAAVLLVAFVAISGVQALHSFSHDIYLHPSSASNAALEFQLQTTRIHGDLLQLATGDDPVIAARLAREITDEELVAREQLRTVRRTLPSEVRQVGELESLMNRWQALRAKVVELAAAGEATKARQLTQSEGTRLFLEIDRRSHHLVGLVRNRAAQFAGEMEAVSNRSLFWMWTAAIAMILLILLSSWRITRAVVLLHREVDRQARRDPLTGVANYRQFLELARPALARSRRLKSPASLLVVDFDHFKTINDTWGHEVGNNALQAFCRLASSTIRGSDLLGRLGGDEFLILLPDTSGFDAVRMAERLRLRVEEFRLRVPDREPLAFSVSIGAVTGRDGTADVPALLREADRALYQAKQAGRNRTCEVAPATAA